MIKLNLPFPKNYWKGGGDKKIIYLFLNISKLQNNTRYKNKSKISVYRSNIKP